MTWPCLAQLGVLRVPHVDRYVYRVVSHGVFGDSEATLQRRLISKDEVPLERR